MSNVFENDNLSLQATVILTENPNVFEVEKLFEYFGLDQTDYEITHVKAEKTISISVEQIRDIIMESSKKNINGKVRVFVFFEADKMKDVAQNSLLKILEEPPQDILLILLAKKAEDILQTILSRCKVIKDKSKKESQVNVTDEKFLLDKVLLPKPEAKLIEKLVWRDANLRQNMLELQCLSNKFADVIDEQKIAKLWLFALWANEG